MYRARYRVAPSTPHAHFILSSPQIRYEHLADTCVREYVKLELSRYAPKSSPSDPALSRRTQEERRLTEIEKYVAPLFTASSEILTDTSRRMDRLLAEVRQHSRDWLSLSRVESLAQAEHMRETMFTLEDAFWHLNEEVRPFLTRPHNRP